ncbi:hypothetical protein [Leptospira ilyithenensis]|uniref:Uncharacterized protein n=1 Tax=Leptospira ilyithenensis TaxID=2484901 RepID=A0A4R9LP71_9LEPT|nr:hypothetical protein [Leptospira ilyithenensis]TGN10875.1 hypothetical protein EHS11_06735 [Leptospira ilyithenensis]
MKKILLITTLSLLAFQCESKQDWRAELEKANKQEELRMAESRAKIQANIKGSYKIENGFSSKEEALIAFLKEVQAGSKSNYKSIFTPLEQETVVFPNTLGSGTSLDSTPLEDYKKLIQSRQDQGIERLREVLKGNRLSIKDVIWETPRTYKKIVGHKPGSLEVLVNGKPMNIDQIKMIFEVNGKFKVGVVAP